MTEQLHFHFSLSCIGEGNGNPLQCSCLENPKDGGAWWAAVYGVAQSRTRLKRLISSNSTCMSLASLGCWPASYWGCFNLFVFRTQQSGLSYPQLIWVLTADFSAYEWTLHTCVHGQSLGHVWIFVTPWTAALQFPLSMGFSWQLYWSGLPLPPLGDLPDPGTEPASPALAGRFFTTEPPRKPLDIVNNRTESKTSDNQRKGKQILRTQSLQVENLVTLYAAETYLVNTWSISTTWGIKH